MSLMKKSYLMTTTTTTKFSGVVEADNENEAFKKIREILPLTHGNVKEKEVDEPTQLITENIGFWKLLRRNFVVSF